MASMSLDWAWRPRERAELAQLRAPLTQRLDTLGPSFWRLWGRAPRDPASLLTGAGVAITRMAAVPRRTGDGHDVGTMLAAVATPASARLLATLTTTRPEPDAVAGALYRLATTSAETGRAVDWDGVCYALAEPTTFATAQRHWAANFVLTRGARP